MAKLFKLLLLSLSIAFSSATFAIQITSRLKTSFTNNQFINNSVATTDPNFGSLNLRVNIDYTNQQHRFVTHYFINYNNGDAFLLANQSGNLFNNTSEKEKLFNLNNKFYTNTNQSLQHGIDRLFYGYYSDNSIIKIGRQAISLGNGLVFQPFDMLNPFAPNQLDKEYKPGQEMLYWQYLANNGNDYSLIIVPRRNTTNQAVTSKASSYIFTGHLFFTNTPINYILGQDRNNKLAGIGTNFDIAAFTIQSDWLIRQYDSLNIHSSFIINTQTSWQWQEKNVSFGVEYFYNGLGINSLNSYQQITPDLKKLLNTGQLFTVKQNYVASTISLQINELTSITPTLLINLDDLSLLASINYSKSLSDNESLLISSSFSPSKQNTEFGGLKTLSTSNQYYTPPLTIRLEYRLYL